MARPTHIPNRPLPIDWEERAKIIDDLIGKINDDIKKAKTLGKRSTYFRVDKYIDRYKPFYDDIKTIYENIGYKIVPTGYIGGVWQLTEDITW